VTVEPRLQRRVQRYGWDLAAPTYEDLWRAQLAPAQAVTIAFAALVPGEQVLDVACGTGVTALEAAARVSPAGRVTGIDLSGRMVETARRRAAAAGCANTCFEQMGAEEIRLPDAAFDVALCSLWLMYVPDPGQALAETRRVLRGGGRLIAAVWGERAACGWADLFPIVDVEVQTEVCPLFFRLGAAAELAGLCARAGFEVTTQCRIRTTLNYADGQQASDAAFVGGPVALAWSRLSAQARARAQARYLEAIARWQRADGSYRIPGEFVVVAAAVP
jgi:ubiquinone/menaquinone biosynthesis C-methylase UbiE